MTTETPEVAEESSTVKVVAVDNRHARRWDEFVEGHPYGTMYHLYGWRQVLARTFGYSSFYLAAVDDAGDLKGVLPLFLMADVVRRKYLISNPFANFAGVCATSVAVQRLLVRHATEIARREKVQYIEFRQLGDSLHAAALPRGMAKRESFVTLILDLEDDETVHWEAISSRNRGKIRKAERAGLEAQVDVELLPEFYKIFVKNLRHLGTPVHPISLFANILSEFPDRADLLTLRHGSKVVSGMFLFRFKDILAEPWVASDRDYHRFYVNNLLYWKAIEYACQNNLAHFDFGRSTADSGTYRFKLQWGARPVPLNYHYVLERADEVPRVDAFDNQYERYISIWKRLPVWVTQIMGPRIVRYLPQL